MRTPALPAPGECHPDFRNRRWLHDWIAEGGSAAVVQLPEWVGAQPDGLDDGRLTSYLLVKRKAFGMAPYVGRRFVYVWYFATDELGRAIASDARIAHTDGAHRGATRAHDVFADVRPPAADVADRKAPGPTLVCIGELEPEEYHDAGCREAVEHRARRRLGAPVEREEWQSNVGGEWLSGFHARALRYRFIVRNMSGRHARPSGGT